MCVGVRSPAVRGAGRSRSKRQEGRRENEIARAASRWKRDKPARDAGGARRNDERAHRAAGRAGSGGSGGEDGSWELRDRRRALVGIKGRSTQARLATERLRAATLSLVRRNPVQIYVQLPCQQCLRSPVRVRAALAGTRGDRYTLADVPPSIADTSRSTRVKGREEEAKKKKERKSDSRGGKSFRRHAARARRQIPVVRWFEFAALGRRERAAGRVRREVQRGSP